MGMTSDDSETTMEGTVSAAIDPRDAKGPWAGRRSVAVPVPRRLAVLVTLILASTALAIVTAATPAAAAPCDPPVANPVACENTLPGSPESEWGITGAGSTSIQGFATDMSVDQGQTIGFKVDTSATSYRLDIYRMGYYGGDGARRVATVTPTVLINQPNCRNDVATGLVDCGNWTQNAAWSVPTTAVSGIYFARLVRTDGTAGASHVFFVVRDDDGGSDLLFQTSDTTWQAYNTYGGNSLYSGAPAGRAYKVSYNRPFTTRGNAPEDWVFNAEYPTVRFLEANGYDVSYSSGVDTDRRGAELLEVVGEASARQGPCEGEADGVRDFPQLVEQRAEDRLLVGEVVIDVPGGDASLARDVADRGRAIALGREELERRVEHVPPAALRFLLSLHSPGPAPRGQRLCAMPL